MALTATRQTRKEVIKRLHMNSLTVVSISPHKPNLVYFVQDKPTIEKFTHDICKQVQQQHTKMGKIIIFCRSYIRSVLICTQEYVKYWERLLHIQLGLQTFSGFELLICTVDALRQL